MGDLSKDVFEMIVSAETSVSPDAEELLRKAHAKEKNALAKKQLLAILENIETARAKKVPLCQDTGMLVFFVSAKKLDSGLKGEIEKAVKDATGKWLLRPNAVCPVSRKVIGNCPSLHFELDEKATDTTITLLPVGAGSENMSTLFMCNPSDDWKKVRERILRAVAEKAKNACPPVIIGIGIGGTADEAALNSKRAILPDLRSENPDKGLAEKESELLSAINSLGIGAMGLGGDTTALAVRILAVPCHTASLPVAIKFQCWAHRKSVLKLKGD